MRTSTRGGIQKRRGPQQKVDRDGDLVMDADAANKRGARSTRGRGSTRGGGPTRGSSSTATPSNQSMQRAQQNILRALGTDQVKVLESRVSHKNDQRQAGQVKLRITGLKQSTAASNPDGGFRDLLGFLDRKAPTIDRKCKSLKIKKSHEDGDSLIISVSQSDANILLKLDQVRFAGTSLSIQPNNTSANRASSPSKELSQDALQLQDRIRGILSKRYDMATKVLNLSALGKDQELISMGMFDADNRITKLFPVLMTVCDRLFTTREAKRDAITGITITDNELDNVSYVTSLAQTFPDLKNLDLSRNKLSTMKSLEAWRWKFRHIDNLIFTGNPVESLPEFREQMLKWYPTLRILNGIQVRSDEELARAAEEAAKLKQGVSPIPIAGPDFRDMSQVGENFIRQFFQGFDSDRAGLLNAFYDDDTKHSLAVNVSAPRAEDTAPASWSSYIKHSRNLVKLTHLSARSSREYRGAEAIRDLWATLPATVHPNINTDFHKYTIDAHPVPGLTDPTGASPRGVNGLILMVHGEFQETEISTSQTSMRSFSRTFILGPGKSPHQPIRVVNDAWIVRAWGPVPLPGSDSNVQETPTQVAPQGAPDQASKDALLQQLIVQTKMTVEYATMCLQESGWNLEQAFISFTNNRDKLPPNAFMT